MKIPSSKIALAGLVVLVSVPSVAWAQAQQTPADPHSTPQEVNLLLGAIDIRLTPALLRERGIDFEDTAFVALDQGRTRYLRVRAVAALAMLGGEEAHELLLHLAAINEDLEVRRQAIISVSKIFGPQEPQRVSAELTALWAQCPEALQRRIDAEKTWLATLFPQNEVPTTEIPPARGVTAKP